MPVQAVSPFTTQTARAGAEAMLLAAVPQIRASAPHETLEQATLNEQRQRDEQQRSRQQEDAAASTLAPGDPASVMRQAERGMEFGSRALRREIGRQHFRDDLDASRRTLRASSATDAATQRTQRQGGAPSRSAGSASSKPARPLAGGVGVSRETAESTAQQRAGQAQTPLRANSSPSPTSGSEGRESPAARSLPAFGGLAAQPARNGPAGESARAVVARSTAAAARQFNAQTSLQSVTGAQPAPSRGGATSTTTNANAVRADAPPPAPASRVTSGGATRTSPPDRAETTERDANIERILRVIRTQIRDRNVSAMMRLDPPELGSLRLQLHLRDHALLLRIDPETEVAHRLLNEDISRLRHGLESAGLNVEHIDIRPPVHRLEAGAPPGADGAAAQPGHDRPDGAGGGGVGDPQTGAGGASHDPPADQSHGDGREADATPFASGTEDRESAVYAAEPRVNVLA